MRMTEYEPMDVLDVNAILLGQFLDGKISEEVYMREFAGTYARAFGHDEAGEE